MDSCYVTPKEDMHKGAYIIADPHKGLRDGALLFDAAQEELARKAAMYLAVQGIALRLIRVDDFERFMAQDQEYKNRLLGGFPAAVIKNVLGGSAWHKCSPGRNARRACQRRKRGYIEVEGPKALFNLF